MQAHIFATAGAARAAVAAGIANVFSAGPGLVAFSPGRPLRAGEALPDASAWRASFTGKDASKSLSSLRATVRGADRAVIACAPEPCEVFRCLAAARLSLFTGEVAWLPLTEATPEALGREPVPASLCAGLAEAGKCAAAHDFVCSVLTGAWQQRMIRSGGLFSRARVAPHVLPLLSLVTGKGAVLPRYGHAVSCSVSRTGARWSAALVLPEGTPGMEDRFTTTDSDAARGLWNRAGGEGHVVSVEEDVIKTPPPELPRLADLLLFGEEKLDKPPRETLAALASLYRRGCITCPLTDSRAAPELEADGLLSRASAVRTLVPLLSGALSQMNAAEAASRFGSEGFPHAIIPTGFVPEDGLPLLEYKLYERTASLFAARLLPAKSVLRTTYRIRLESTGLVLESFHEKKLEEGWTAVLPGEDIPAKKPLGLMTRRPAGVGEGSPVFARKSSKTAAVTLRGNPPLTRARLFAAAEGMAGPRIEAVNSLDDLGLTVPERKRLAATARGKRYLAEFPGILSDIKFERRLNETADRVAAGKAGLDDFIALLRELLAKGLPQ